MTFSDKPEANVKSQPTTTYKTLMTY